jgi:hypothetical protein
MVIVIKLLSDEYIKPKNKNLARKAPSASAVRAVRMVNLF